MKKKLITLIICGVIGGTSVAGFATYSMSKDANDQQTLVSAHDDADKKETVKEKTNKLKEAESKKADTSTPQKKSGQATTSSNEKVVSKGNNTSNVTNGGTKSQSNDVQGAAAPPVEPSSDSKDNGVDTSNNVSSGNDYSSSDENNANESLISESTITPSQEATNGNFFAQVEQLIFSKVNEERAKAGVPALSYNSTMETYARIKSKDMGDNNYFDHNNLSGELITAQMSRDGVSYSAWGENIAYIGGVSDAAALANQFMTNWMNSQGHKENILSSNFSSIGVGVYKSGNRYYATQEFYK